MQVAQLMACFIFCSKIHPYFAIFKKYFVKQSIAS